MRRFRFTLEAVRELREQAETSAKEALARQLARGVECQNELAEASRRLESARSRAVSETGARVDAAELRARQAYLERREVEQAIAALGASTQAERVEAGRRVLMLAARDRRAIERLKERQRREHLTAVARAEERLLGDIGLAVHRRGNEQSAE